MQFLQIFRKKWENLENDYRYYVPLILPFNNPIFLQIVCNIIHIFRVPVIFYSQCWHLDTYCKNFCYSCSLLSHPDSDGRGDSNTQYLSSFCMNLHPGLYLNFLVTLLKFSMAAAASSFANRLVLYEDKWFQMGDQT